MTPARSYRDRLSAKGIRPIVIERTMKRAGELVLDNSVNPARRVEGRKGCFAGYRA